AVGELSRRVGVTDKTCTGLVDRLEEKGFVERVRDDEDRRVVRVRLTTRGTGTFAELDAEVFRKFTGFLALLGEDDRQSLFRILENLLQTLLERAASR
ncbi:MAG: MarR family winged helix-turn-helix transcriptional regulator, partial [Myxococcales bacterium]